MGVLVSAVVGAVLGLAACGGFRSGTVVGDGATPSPVYYVDGARPLPGAEDSDTGEGCVPWSPERTDVDVCGPIPEGFEPAPPPGNYADYPALCDEAARIFDERAEGLVQAYGLRAPPRIAVQSCGAAGKGSKEDGRWLAKFGLANAGDVSPYRSAWVMNLTTGGVSELPVTVVLREDPWPVK